MATVKNSLSMNAVNFQKAKSAPIAIAKNIKTPIEKSDPISIPELGEVTDKEVAFLRQAKAQGMDAQGALEFVKQKRQPTFLQEVGQTVKNIAGGVAGGLPALGPNVAGGLMKGIGTPMFEGYQKAQGENIQPNILQKGGQELIDRGSQMRDIIEQAVGANPEDTSTQLSRSVVPLVASTVASGPLGLTKAGAGAFQTAKAGITARSLPTIAKSVAQGAAVGGAEQAMVDVAQTGKTTPQNVALGATIGGVLPVAVPLLQQGAKAVGKQLSKLPNVGKGVKQTITRDFPIGRIEKDLNLTPTERAVVENTGETAGEFMLKKNIASLAKEAQINKLQTLADDSYNGITNLGKSITERNQSVEAKKMLETMMDEMNKSDIVKREMPEYIQKLGELAQQEDYGFNELLAIRRDFDRIVGNDIFNKMGRVSGQEDKILAGWRAKVADQLDETGTKAGVDIKEMNNDIRKSIVIRDGLLKRLSQENKNNTFGLQDIGIGAILGQGDPITSTAIVIGKKALEKATPGIAQRLYNLSDVKNVPVNLKRGVAISTRDTTNGLSIAPTVDSSLTTPGVKEPQQLTPSTKAHLVQSTKETPKLPVDKKTTLKQANITPKRVQELQAIDAINPKQELMNRITDNESKVRKVIEETNPTLPKIKIDDFIERAKLGKAGTDEMVKEILNKLDAQKLSPKTPKVLNKTTPLSKVDDALPVGEKMKLYHGTNAKFNKFSNEKLRDGAFGKGLYVTSSKDSAQRRGNAARIAKGGEARVIDIDIPEGSVFKNFNNEADFNKFIKDSFSGDKSKAIDFLQKNYDGLSIKEGVLKSNSGTYVIFDPEKLLQTPPTTHTSF